jgi:hypothetical protein
VYESLGDIHRFNGNFPGAIDEYQRSLELREVVCEDNDRLLAQAYYSLAVAHIYLAGETQQTEGGPTPVSPEAALAGKKTALRLYAKAKEVLTRPPPALVTDSEIPTTPAGTEEPSPAPAPSTTSSSSTLPPPPPPLAPLVPAKVPLSEAEERKELCDEISETIAALEQEIRSMEAPSSSSSSSAPLHNPAKLIGASTTTVGFGQPSASTAAPMLEVKRKATAPVSAAAAAGAAAVKRSRAAESPSTETTE